MNILITGGLGTIGNSLVPELRQRGHRVRICDLSHHHDKDYTRCDVGSYKQLLDLFDIFDSRRFDYVFHLAAEFGRWNGERYYDALWRTNVVGTKNLIRLQEDRGFRMVFFSSSEVYGDWDGVMSEDVMDKRAIRQLNDYAMTKWVNEQQIMNSAEEHSTETVRVRLFNTYGPGEFYSPYRSVICQFIYSALMALPYLVYLEHTRTSTYVTDTVRTLANILDNFKPGEVYNVGGTQVHSIKFLSDFILQYLGLSDKQVRYFDSEPFTTRHKVVDCQKAIRDLDHKCLVSLEDGLAKTIEWMKGVYL